jgi:hypothetical protein
MLSGVSVNVAPVGKPVTLNATFAGKVVDPRRAERQRVAVPPGATVGEVVPPVVVRLSVKSSTCSLPAALVTVMKFVSPE